MIMIGLPSLCREVLSGRGGRGTRDSDESDAAAAAAAADGARRNGRYPRDLDGSSDSVMVYLIHSSQVGEALAQAGGCGVRHGAATAVGAQPNRTGTSTGLARGDS